MRRRLAIRIGVVVALIGAGLLYFRSGAPAAAERAGGDTGTVAISASSKTTVTDVRRAGVNLGIWSSWGAEQLSSNVLKNPGFEGMVDRAIVMVGTAGARSFSDDQTWTSRPDGFWKGALCDVRTGKSAGRQTHIVASQQTGPSGLPRFETAEDLGLSTGDVLALTRLDDSQLPANWWFPTDAAGLASVDTRHPRPGSSGVRALSLQPRGNRAAEAISYLDMITERGGKMLPVNGAWRLSFWTAAPDGDASLTVRFYRQGAPAFVQESLTPGTAWQRQSIDFGAADLGPAGPLELHFRVSGANRVLLDDVELRSVDDATAFRKPVIEALQKLHPGYLRDWEGQLGDTLDNRLGDPYARRTTRYRPGDASESDFLYSIPEFLELCRQVGADPWLVMPVTFTDDEWSRFGRWMAQEYRKGGFHEVLVEFGNENWNRVFRTAGIPEPAAHGQASDRAFRLIREAAGGDVPLKFVINAQHANPEYAARFLAQSKASDIIALAPYFFRSLSKSEALQTSYRNLFAGDDGRLRLVGAKAAAAGKEAAVYEVNIHTVEGDAPQRQRDSLVAGRPAAAALAKTVLDAYAGGMRRQCVYVLSGFDVYLSKDAGYTRLFGLMRDFGETVRMRPTGLALAMLNRAVGGDYHAIPSPSAQNVSAYAFHSREGWSVAMVSASAETQMVSVTLPAEPEGALPARMLRLLGETPDATNEDTEAIRIVEEAAVVTGRTVSVELPPWGLAVVTPKGGMR